MILTVFICLGWVVGRYMVDFVPQLILAGWTLMAAMWQPQRLSPGSKTVLFKAAIGWLAVYAVALDVASCLQ
jgi:hypothetical protein